MWLRQFSSFHPIIFWSGLPEKKFQTDVKINATPSTRQMFGKVKKLNSLKFCQQKTCRFWSSFSYPFSILVGDELLKQSCFQFVYPEHQQKWSISALKMSQKVFVSNQLLFIFITRNSIIYKYSLVTPRGPCGRANEFSHTCLAVRWYVWRCIMKTWKYRWTWLWAIHLVRLLRICNDWGRFRPRQGHRCTIFNCMPMSRCRSHSSSTAVHGIVPTVPCTACVLLVSLQVKTRNTPVSHPPAIHLALGLAWRGIVSMQDIRHSHTRRAACEAFRADQTQHESLWHRTSASTTNKYSVLLRHDTASNTRQHRLAWD